jgi:hypothetical protein
MGYKNKTVGAPWTGNGDFLLTEVVANAPLAKPGTDMVLEVSGAFGTATVKPYWVDLAAAKQILQDSAGADITTTVPMYWSFKMPISRALGFEVTGSDGETALVFDIYATPRS